MCTASWLIRPGGFELFFNRDESVARSPATPPTLASEDDVRYLAPTDGDAGGTWIAANEHGLVACLLNAWDLPERRDPAGATSRGWLVRRLMAAASLEEVRARLDAADLQAFRGFRVIGLEPGRPPAVFAWDGRELGREEALQPVCSSSLGAQRAHEERARVLGELSGARSTLNADVLEAFHRSHAPTRGPWSPCMHRADASTVSAARVTVDASTVALRYAPGPPCETPWSPPRTLARSMARSMARSGRPGRLAAR